MGGLRHSLCLLSSLLEGCRSSPHHTGTSRRTRCPRAHLCLPLPPAQPLVWVVRFCPMPVIGRCGRCWVEALAHTACPTLAQPRLTTVPHSFPDVMCGREKFGWEGGILWEEGGPGGGSLYKGRGQNTTLVRALSSTLPTGPQFVPLPSPHTPAPHATSILSSCLQCTLHTHLRSQGGRHLPSCLVSWNEHALPAICF